MKRVQWDVEKEPLEKRNLSSTIPLLRNREVQSRNFSVRVLARDVPFLSLMRETDVHVLFISA